MKNFLTIFFKKESEKKEIISLSTILSNLVKLEAASSFGKMILI